MSKPKAQKKKQAKLSPTAKAFNRGIEAAADFVNDQGEDALAHEIRNLIKDR